VGISRSGLKKVNRSKTEKFCRDSFFLTSLCTEQLLMKNKKSAAGMLPRT